MLKPDYLFEVSWEVCNKVGGIHTVVSTKAKTIVNELNDNYILIGPDVWKETHNNPEFIEDKNLLKSWHLQAETEGLKFRIGRWNLADNPIVILVDFTPFFNDKDKIFSELWTKYKLDSLSGQWDYIEPALFGYASAKVIESYYNFFLTSSDKIVAQFHEWMTATGILYLKDKMPQAACVFTTHATVLGRCVAGNNIPLYKNPERFIPDALANEFNVKAKHSLEKIAARESDSFTTVSDITAKECEIFLSKKPDVVTLNGFEPSFVPNNDNFDEKRRIAREKLLNVASTLINKNFSDDTLLIINSGRYEFKNKGIDLFIDALGELNKINDFSKDIIAFIMVPAGQSGHEYNLYHNLNNDDKLPLKNNFITHNLFDEKSDPVVGRVMKNNLINSKESNIHIVFVPCYLNGFDGIFDMHYYDLLIGFDLSVFPSYYEPWGYTPLESIAFHIPTITTSLAGFGMWATQLFPNADSSVIVINRTDDNDAYVVNAIAEGITEIAKSDKNHMKFIRQTAFNISSSALWTELIDNYRNAYDIALQKVDLRIDLFSDKYLHDVQSSKPIVKFKPEWKKILITHNLPEKLKPLTELSKNLWWSWNYEAIELFESISPELWKKFEHNPIPMLESLSTEKFNELENNGSFMNRLNDIYKKYNDYIEKSIEKDPIKIAYFSMEFGLHDSVKIFSGGLGVLAGDYLKEASDSNKNIFGIGLLYRYGYFKQSLSVYGEQIDEYLPQKFSHMPLIPVKNENSEWIIISIALPGRTVYAKAWQLNVGRIPLYLLDTDIDENSDADKNITNKLYGEDNEHRFKQELILGVGGIRLLEKLNLNPDLYHINEGHAAFIGLERLRKLVQDEKLSFLQAVEVVRTSSLFTTHTPVPAGHDCFPEELLRTYIPHYPERLNISWDTFMNLGRFHENLHGEKFSMSVLAAKLSQQMNGVSRIHGRVSREMFAELYEGYFPEEIHVGYVTNGVHYPTWTSKNWQKLYKNTFNDNFLNDQSNSEYWKGIHNVEDEVIWDVRNKHRKELIDYIKERFSSGLSGRNENPRQILKTVETLNDKVLTIGFARRFATYKRAYLIFSNIERLSKIINNSKMPVQFLFAGKAHPKDKPGADLIKLINDFSHRPEFAGKIVFIDNYDMNLASKLISGVDIWMNTPTRPLEASGTSGEKAIMNGVVNFSVLDGWWAEGYVPNAGWALKEERTYTDQKLQDELDSETIYNLLSDEIIPSFYKRNENNVPENWISHIKNTISEITPRFTMKRMIDDYYSKFYNSLYSRKNLFVENNYALAKKMASWKIKVINGWNDVEVVSMNLPDLNTNPLNLGDVFKIEISLNINGLNANDIGIEIIIGQKVNDEVKSIFRKEELYIKNQQKNIITYYGEVSSKNAGVYDYAFRIYPKNDLLPHRMDFPLVKWI